MFSNKFKESSFGKKLYEDLSEPYDKSKSQMNALSSSMYSVSRWELFKACLSREFLLMKRNSFIYIFKSSQVMIFELSFVLVLNESIPLFLSMLQRFSLLHFCPAAYCNRNHCRHSIFAYPDEYRHSSCNLLHGCLVLCTVHYSR